MKQCLASAVCSVLFALVLPGQDASTEDGIRAFRQIASVLTSARCINCHISADYPLQGDDSHPHIMKVARGSDGSGANPAMRCSNCHQESNVMIPHAPPGVAGWRMPSSATPMAWQGLSTAQLCRVLKDPRTNGNRSLTELVKHVTSDRIVNWGWNPGPGRSIPPVSHQEFVSATKVWVAAGAPCPE